MGYPEHNQPQKRHTSFRRTTFRPLKSKDVLLCIEKKPNLKHMLSFAGQIGRKINIWNHHHLVEIPWRQQRWNPEPVSRSPKSTCGSGQRPANLLRNAAGNVLLQRFPWWTSQPTLKRFPPKIMGQRKGSVIDLAYKVSWVNLGWAEPHHKNGWAGRLGKPWQNKCQISNTHILLICHDFNSRFMLFIFSMVKLDLMMDRKDTHEFLIAFVWPFPKGDLIILIIFREINPDPPMLVVISHFPQRASGP